MRIKIQILICTVACIFVPLRLSNAVGENFTIEIEVKTSSVTKTSKQASGSTRPTSESRPRLKAKSGETLQVNWKIKNIVASTFSDILVHCFVAPVRAPGQTEMPKLTKDVVYESALTMDFKPSDQASGQMMLKIRNPGFYLLRVEIIEPENNRPSQDFAAMDIEIE